MRLPRLHEIKGFVDRLLRDRLRSRSPLPAPPTFADAAFFAHLTEPASAVAAWREGRHDAAWQALIEHFRRRVPSFGFIATDEVAARRAEAERRFPSWGPRLLAKVREDRDHGLAVYDRRSGPLSATFDWKSGASGPLEDRLYRVRPHRFGFLPRWSLACHFDPTFIAHLDGVLAGWMRAADPSGHPAFNSSHVVLYNYTALLLAWPFLAALEAGGAESALHSLRRRALLILYEDSRFLRAAAGSAVANNHLLAERFGDWLTAALLPEFDHALDRDQAEGVWLDELQRQTYADGGSFEHSVHYQEHVCEMAVAYLVLSRRNGWHVPPPMLDRIERLVRFQLALAGPALLPLALGNTTEDPLLPLGVGEGWQSGFLREVQRRCFATNVPAAHNDDPTVETAFWLLGSPSDSDAETLSREIPFQDFPDSGFIVFAEPDSAARLILRLGPSPTAPGIGGHSHCDLLSLHLSIGDAPALPPPGTGTYRFKTHPELRGHPNLRAHFASASSRSGFFFEGSEPYGALRGDFRDWQLPCQVASRRASSAFAGLSWVDGQVVGRGTYVGQRRGVLHVWEHGWLVYDHTPDAPAGASAFIGWQFAPDVTLEVDDLGCVRASGTAANTLLYMLPCGTAEPTVVSGGFEPFRGWISPAYGRLTPAPNLRFPLPAVSAVAGFFLSVRSTAGHQLRQIAVARDGLVFAMTSAQQEMLLVVATGEQPQPLQWGDSVFHGRAACVWRERAGLRIRALGLTKLAVPSLALELSSGNPTDFEIVLANGTVQWPRTRVPDSTLEIHRDRR